MSESLCLGVPYCNRIAAKLNNLANDSATVPPKNAMVNKAQCCTSNLMSNRAFWKAKLASAMNYRDDADTVSVNSINEAIGTDQKLS